MAGHDWHRVYRGVCSLLLAAGVAGMIGAVAFPPEFADPVSGEMPPAFGSAADLAMLGLAGLLADLAGAVAARLLRWTRHRRMR